MNSEIQRLERKVDQLLRIVGEGKKPYWVKVGIISGLTGWDKEGMRMARENGYVKYKVEEDGMWYDLNSVHESLIKKH